VKLRAATASDYEAIVRLVPSRDELFLVYPKGRHPFSVSQLKVLADSRLDLTVAVSADEVVGFANLYDLRPGQWVFIGNVVVSPARRGEGLGRILVKHMVALAFEKYTVEEVRISVFGGNTPALLLYSGLGFEPYAIEERQHPSGTRMALIHMRLDKVKAP
jgi:ribosomal protein S18 acetylase RimI-like enzyme